MFRSALLFATAALAAFTAAAPTTAPVDSVAAPAQSFPPTTGITNGLTRRSCDCKSLDKVFIHAQVDVDAFTQKCHKKIQEKPITVEVAVELIAEVKALCLDITALVKAMVEVKVVDIKVCVDIVVKVLVNLIVCLNVIVKACISVKIDLTVILKLVAEVLVCIAALIKLILTICVDIKVALCLALKVALKLIVDLHIDIKVILDVLAIVKL